MKRDSKYKGIKPLLGKKGTRTLAQTLKTIEAIQRELSKLKPEEIPEIFQPF